MSAPLGGFSPMKVASPSDQPPPANMRCCAGRPDTNATSFPSISFESARSGVRSSTIQMPRPCVASTRSPSRGWIWRSRAAVGGHLQIAVVGADPDGVRVARGLADHRDGGVGLRRGVVHGDAARLFLALLLRIVGGEIRRDALPGVAAIPGAEEELRAD